MDQKTMDLNNEFALLIKQEKELQDKKNKKK